MTPLEARNDIAKAYKYASFMDLLVACVNKKTPQALEGIIEECMTHYASFKEEEQKSKIIVLQPDVIKSVCQHEGKYLAIKGAGCQEWCPDCKKWIGQTVL